MNIWNTVIPGLFVVFCLTFGSVVQRAQGQETPVCRPYVQAKTSGLVKVGHPSDVKIHLERPRLCNSKADQKLNARLGELAREFISGLDTEDAHDGARPFLAGRMGWHVQAGPFLSFFYKTEEFMGGAHPTPSCITFVFDMRSGKCLGPDDILQHPDEALPIIAKTALAQLEKRRGEMLPKPERFRLAPEPENYTHLLLAPNGLLFLFPVSQTGARFIGMQNATIPYSAIRNWMRPDIVELLQTSRIPQ